MTMKITEEISLVQLTIDGRSVSVPKGTTVYHAAAQLGVELPIFCYQDRMPPFGACRVCLVEVEKMNKLQTSCTLPVQEGMIVKTQTQLAKEGRESILELLLINHPLDCPVCDKGGECPLQDQTLAFGPGNSRFYEDKRRFVKPYALGPLLMLDRERCITCARCTRFGDIVAGDHALELVDRGFKTEVGTPGGRPVESKFIGNTIMICPVGALTSDVYRFRARPWDNQQVETACTLCPVGCSMILDERDGEIMRTRSRENKSINDIWMCDKGWFGYEFATFRARLQKPLIRKNGQLEVACWEEALSTIANKLQEAQETKKIAGWGGNPLTTEENFLFQQLIREASGTSHLDHRIGMPIFPLDAEGLPPGMEISIGDCESLKYAVLLGIDLTEEFPVVWLRLKQAINEGAKVSFYGHYAPEISTHLSCVTLHAPGQELNILSDALSQISSSDQAGAVFLGRQYLASPQRAEIISLLVEWRKKFPLFSLNILEGRGNSVGARWAGVHPEVGPLGRKLENPGLNALQLLETASKDGWDLLYVAGADPVKKIPSKLWSEARKKLKCLVVQDIFLTETARQADVVLPSLCFLEKSGTFLTIAHQIQRLKAGKVIPQDIYADGEIFHLLGKRLGISLQEDFSEFLGGTLRPERPTEVAYAYTKPTEAPLQATIAHALFDQGMRMKHNAHLQQVVKKAVVRIHPREAIKGSLIDGGPARLRVNGVAINCWIAFDEKVADGTAVLPLGFDELPLQELGSNLLNGLAIELSPM